MKAYWGPPVHDTACIAGVSSRKCHHPDCRHPDILPYRGFADPFGPEPTDDVEPEWLRRAREGKLPPKEL